MQTELHKVDNSVDNHMTYQQAVDCLREGGLVAFPTETVYGLGALATNAEAVHRIFEAKGRPSDNPLIVHIGTKEEATHYAIGITKAAEQLMDAFWPGPLTLVFQERPGVIAKNVTAGRDTIGLRMPNHPVALELLQRLDGPLAAPSANKSGKPSPTKASHVLRDMDGDIPLILDGGATGVGLESTVLDMTTTPPVILRPGGITTTMIENIIGPVVSETNVLEHEVPRAPGMKYKHYSPNAPVWLIKADPELLETAVKSFAKQQLRVAVIGPNELRTTASEWYFGTGAQNDFAEHAANLYEALRECDDTEADVILAVETNMEGMGIAVMNRLTKAADGKRFER